MAAPVYEGSGAAAHAASGVATVSPTFPSGIAANDLLALVVERNNTAGPGASASGFVSRGVLAGDNPSIQLLTKTAAGTESGTLAVTVASTSVKIAKIYRFSNVDTAAPIHVAWASFSNSTAATDMTPAMPSVTTTISETMAVALLDSSGDIIGDGTDPTGESGGSWIFRSAERPAGANAHAFSLYTAAMASAGTISGGAAAYSGASASWNERVCSFALKGADDLRPQSVM